MIISKTPSSIPTQQVNGKRAIRPNRTATHDQQQPITANTTTIPVQMVLPIDGSPFVVDTGDITTNPLYILVNQQQHCKTPISSSVKNSQTEPPS